MRTGLQLCAVLFLTVMPLNFAEAQRTASGFQPPDRGGRGTRTSRPDFEEIRRRVAAARTPEERSAIMREYLAQRGSSTRSFGSTRSFPSSSRTTQPAPTTAAANTVAQTSPEDEYPGAGPAIDVEILFVELIADKDGPVRFNGTITDVEKKIRELKASGKVVSVSRIATSAVDGNKSTSQIGSTQAVARGTTSGFGGGRSSSSRIYSSANFGTLVTVMPFVDDDGAISLKLQIEKSWLKGDNGSSGEPGESTSYPSTATVTVKNSVRVRNGRVVTVASSTQEAKGGSTQIVTLATAKLAEGEKIPSPVSSVPQASRTVKIAPAGLKDAIAIIKQLAGENAVALDYDQVANILILRGEAKLIGDLAAALQAYIAQQKSIEEKPAAKEAKE